MNHLALDAAMQGGVLGTSILGVGALVWYHQSYLHRMQEELASLESLSTSFQRTHARHVQDADEFVASLWQRVRGPLQLALQAAFDDGNVPAVSQTELQQLRDILEIEIPKLRRLASHTK
jgi:hypothetical protein